MPDPRHELGARAEAAAARWLTSRGWQVIERRWRTRGGELDLVCVDPAGALVGVEVKVRRSGRSGNGPESVDRRRLGRLRHALAAYAAANPGSWRELRLDLVTLEPLPGPSGGPGGWRLRRLPEIDGW